MVRGPSAAHERKSAKPRPSRRAGKVSDLLAGRTPPRECVNVQMDAGVQTRRRIDGEMSQEVVLGARGRDELGDNDKLLLRFAETK